jgi:hypothetical protein
MTFKSLATMFAMVLASAACAHAPNQSAAGGSSTPPSNAADAATASVGSGAVPSSCIGLTDTARSQCMKQFGEKNPAQSK